MNDSVVQATARAIAAFCSKFHQPACHLIFGGAEPMLAGTEWFRQAIKVFRGQLPISCASSFELSTDGLLFDCDWANLCAELQIGVMVRFQGALCDDDSHCENADLMPPLASIRRIQQMKAIQHLFKGVSWVVKPDEDGRNLYRLLRSAGVTTMDFILPSAINWDHPPRADANSTPFADYLIPLFDEWWSENDPDVRIGYFESLLRLLAGSRVHSDTPGDDPLVHLVIDSDGTIEPTEALQHCGAEFGEPKLNAQKDSIESVFQQPLWRTALQAQETLCLTCRECELRDVCRGGNVAFRFRQSNYFDNPSIFCADHAKLIRHVVDVCSRQQVA